MWWISLNLSLLICALINFQAYSFKTVKSNNIDDANLKPLCASMCSNMYPKVSLKLKNVERPRNACQQACELVCRMQLSSEASSLICQKDCLRSYTIPSEWCACNLGCFSKLIPPLLGTPPLEWYPPNTEDTEPDDVLLDPALRTQLKADESPLPHLRIKTLPHQHLQSVEELLYQQFMDRESLLQDPSVTSNRKYWYDYFVTRMVLAAAIMLSVMCALWLCLVPQPNKSTSVHQCESQEGVLHKLDGNTSEPPKYNEIEFLPPPSPPPKYSEVVHQLV